MVAEVDAAGLAGLGAGGAIAALLLVEVNLQEGEAGEETEGGADGADGVAVGATAYPGEHDEADEGGGSDDEGGETAEPDVGGVEGVAVVVLGDGGEAVVGQLIERAQQVDHDAAEAAVGRQQGDEGAEACDEGDDVQHEHGVAQPLHFGGVGVAAHLFILSRAQVREAILQDAEGANDGAIDASEDERQHHEGDDDSEVQRQDGGQELHLG